LKSHYIKVNIFFRMSKINIRASMLPSYFDCARRAASKQYANEIKSAGYELRNLNPSVGAALGTAVHAGTEHMHRVKMATGDIGELRDAVQKAIESFDAGTLDGAEWDDTTTNPAAAHFQIRRMLAAYQELAARIMPRTVEN
jgi:hypothetical protein